MADIRAIFRRSLELSRSGRKDKAVALIESGLGDPSLASDPELLAELAMYAGIICGEVGDLHRAYKFYQEALRLAEDDPGVLYGLADICVALNDREHARAFFTKCYEVCVARGKQVIAQSYLELLETRAEFWK